MRITQKDVARLAGVDRTTVSMVVNNDPRVSDTTRKKILKIISETGFRPNAAARSLAKSHMFCIGVCFYDSSYVSMPFFANIIQGILEIATAEGYSLLITTTQSFRDSNEINIMKPVIERRIDGLIICDDIIEEDVLKRMQDMNFPFVMINRNVRINNSVHTVNGDYYKATELATQHLIDLGHRRIGLVVAHPDFSFTKDKIYSYKHTLEKNGIKFDTNYIGESKAYPPVQGKPDRENLSLYGIDMRSPNAPTAIILSDVDMAAYVIKVMRGCDYLIPEDFSIIAYDDVPEAINTQPSLTNICTHNKKMGNEAAKMLLNMVTGAGCEMQHVVIEPELVIRESTRPVPLR